MKVQTFVTRFEVNCKKVNHVELNIWGFDAHLETRLWWSDSYCFISRKTCFKEICMNLTLTPFSQSDRQKAKHLSGGTDKLHFNICFVSAVF